MIRALLNFFRTKDRNNSGSRNIHQFAEENRDVAAGYRLSATMSPATPLGCLERHGEIRPTISAVEQTLQSPYFIWLPETADEFDFLDRGASMSSSVGYLPADGGDFLPYLIEIRKIIEAPRDHSLTELADAFDRATRISKIEAAYGYAQDSDYNFIKKKKNSNPGSYYDILSTGDSRWALGFVLREPA